jgi:hypothetical protein
MDKQPQPQTQDKQEAKPVVKKNRRNRHFHKEILEDTASEMKLLIKHQSHKGETISDTVRRDRKFNPRQRFQDLNGKNL